MSVERLQGVSLNDGQTLARFWQQAPVILEQAVDTNGLVPETDTLVQILTETDMPSRLLTGAEGQTFTLDAGPFDRFHPPKKPWSVLIHALEHLFPEYDQIRKSIHWLPHWRFEDCMLSWASVGGSVGRHCDEFSVFLIQLNGRRTWEIGPEATVETPTVSGQPIALVEPLGPWTSWTAHPGDVLYLPPKMIHHGVSLDPYLTLISFLIFILISKTLDFFLAISVLSVFVSYYWGERRFFYLLLVSIIFPIIVFIFFETILGLRFPPGIITNIYYQV